MLPVSSWVDSGLNHNNNNIMSTITSPWMSMLSTPTHHSISTSSNSTMSSHLSSYTTDPTKSMENFLDNDILNLAAVGMSRSNSQPDLTTLQSLMNRRTLSECSDDLYLDMGNGTGNSNTIDDMFLGIEADFINSNISDFLDYDLPDCLDSYVVNSDTKSLNNYSSFFDFSTQTPQNSFPLQLQQTQQPILLETTLSTVQQQQTIGDSTSTSSRPSRSAPPSPKQVRKKQRSSITKTWAKMSPDEQSNTITELTTIINEQLGRREQLEIIRILQPDGVQIQKNQTEFILDFQSMNDEKYRRIRNIIKFNVETFNDNTCNTKQDTLSETNSLSNKSSSANSGGTNSQQDPLKRIEKILRLRQRKEQRQAMKEQKSGLFLKHEVMELTKCDEDIEVDILS
ncbi:unnamed protein product [Didymodactylos carnosus]|nr:unnamed protein product [Didymodactylos carnosus]CAF3884781.1 unnamed protein product [Didymodactylos carnosus]